MVRKAFDELKSKGLIYRCSFTQLSRHLLKKILNTEFDTEFHELRRTFIQHDLSNDEPPIDEQDFHKWVCRTILGLVKEPREELLEVYESAIIDLSVIDDRLKDIQTRLFNLQSEADVSQKQEWEPILRYYKEHNEEVRAEILEFIKNGSHFYALNGCYDSKYSIQRRVPYKYAWNRESYEPKTPSDLDNKFRELPILSIRELKKDYELDKTVFNKKVSEYIEKCDIIQSINDLLNQHHILFGKSDIIYETLNAFSEKKMLFANAVPTIVEGIMHDLCIEIGIDRNILLKAGFHEKLKHLLPILGNELYYEYYAFRFRLFRNKAAHGLLTKSEVEELSDLLLLDLYHVCRLVNSLYIKTNQKRHIITGLSNNFSSPDYKLLLAYLFLKDVSIPDFYKLNNQIETIEKLFSSDGFWAFLENEIKSESEEASHGIYRILEILKKRQPVDSRCKALFSKLGISKADDQLARFYFGQVSSFFY
jgi:predicted nucleic-acid-binding protein